MTLLVSGFKYKNVWTQLGKTKIWESKKQKVIEAETVYKLIEP